MNHFEQISKTGHSLRVKSFVQAEDCEDSLYGFSYTAIILPDSLVQETTFFLTNSEIANIVDGGTFPNNPEQDFTTDLETKLLTMIRTIHTVYWIDEDGCLLSHGVVLV